MSTFAPATLPLWHRFFDMQDAVRTDPPSRPSRQPIFIHDAVTPYRGETLLSHLLRKDLDALDQSDE